MPLPDGRFDAACLCVSVQYLQQPVAVLREVHRVAAAGSPLDHHLLQPVLPHQGGVAIWQAMGGADQQQLVALYLQRAGFETIETRHRSL